MSSSLEKVTVVTQPRCEQIHKLLRNNLNSRAFEWSPEGRFNHRLLDRTVAAPFYSWKEGNYTDGRMREKWKERKDCLFCLEMEAGVEKATVRVVG